jgi:hypothetical protein
MKKSKYTYLSSAFFGAGAAKRPGDLAALPIVTVKEHADNEGLN